MIKFAPAKINLGLAVQGKRPDGYHELTSIFYAVPLFDVLEILPAASFSVQTLGLEIEGELEDNLVYKAYTLMASLYPIKPCQIILQKNIPMGAGLGGGSSDAAQVINGLADFNSLTISTETKEELAAQLGSDCPFFIEKTAKLVKGRGEVLLPCDLNLNKYFIQLIYPNVHVSTKEAFAGLKPESRPDIEQVWLQTKPENWKEILFNDFETSIFPQHPILQEIKNQLYQAGAFYASMSGSGSTLFGLFEEEPTKLNLPNTQEWIISLDQHID